VISAPRSKE